MDGQWYGFYSSTFNCFFNGSQQYELDESAKRFYEEAAVAAASLGVSVDVYVASSESCGLDLIEPLAGSSGGALLFYPTLEQAALPQVSLPNKCLSALTDHKN